MKNLTISKNEVLAMKKGRKLNSITIEEVFGYKQVKDDLKPSREMRTAMHVIDHLRSKDEIYIDLITNADGYNVVSYNGHEVIFATKADLCEAICKMAIIMKNKLYD